MSNVVNVMKQVATIARPALRWGLDVVRGYMHASNMRESVVYSIAFGARCADPVVKATYADSADTSLLLLSEERGAPGGMGAGARLAMDPAEWLELRLRADELRAEAFARPVDARAEA